MGRSKGDGRGRLGGRQAGTPNKSTQSIRAFLEEIVADNREQFKADLAYLEPQERVRALIALLPYITPRQQTLTLADEAKVREEALRNWVETAPQEALASVAQQVAAIQAEKLKGVV